MEVTLMQMLEAREARALRQAELIRQYGKPLVCFSMNIAGPVKDTPLIRRGFFEGCRELQDNLTDAVILHREIKTADTGCEAMYVVETDPVALKKMTTRIEDAHGLGRLFDMDVIDPAGLKLQRETVGGNSRGCIVCGAPGRGCASRRLHRVEQLQSAACKILTSYFGEQDAAKIADLAVRSLLDEVDTTPKPGLVDRRNNGSHVDMDLTLFHISAAALREYFRRCVCLGMESTGSAPGELFAQLRRAGIQAEKDMYRATGGVNTHKGAIFTLGILCGAAGRLWDPVRRPEESRLFREISAMTREAMEADWHKGGDTIGQRLYARYGIRGIRGQAAEGLPGVERIGLPVFREALAQGKDRNTAGVITLLSLITQVEDTNMIARGGLSGAAEGTERVRELMRREFTRMDVEALDDWFIEHNLSPGGCADLLAAVYFVQGLGEISGDD